MRYYDLKVSDPATGRIWKPTAAGNGFELSAGGSTFTSWVNRNGQWQTDPGALNIEFDAPIVPMNTPQGNTMITVWGVGLRMIGQAANLNGQNILLSAGMKPGLPLATAAANQAGPILQGSVFQAYGNWQSVNQTLHLVVNPGAAAQGDQNIAWSWPKGTPLARSLQLTLQQAFGTQYKIVVNIGANLFLSNDEGGHYQSLSDFASAIADISLKVGTPIFGDGYGGALIVVVGNTIYCTDGTAVQAPKQLQFRDFIGQPTWISATQVSWKMNLRSDIAINSQVKFPPEIQAPYALTSEAAAQPNAPASWKTIFQGAFSVTEVHHFANYRQADADSWVTAFTAAAPPLPTGTATLGPVITTFR